MTDLVTLLATACFTFAAGIFTVLSLVEKPVWSLMRDPMSPLAEDRIVRDIHAQLGSGQVFMRAIPMQEQPCAACHGTNIAPEVKAAIDQAYPEDLAIGFKPGELRGAFLVGSSTPMDK